VESKDFPLVKRTAKGIKKEVKMANGIWCKRYVHKG
jgi:hypothetical protein